MVPAKLVANPLYQDASPPNLTEVRILSNIYVQFIAYNHLIDFSLVSLDRLVGNVVLSEGKY